MKLIRPVLIATAAGATVVTGIIAGLGIFGVFRLGHPISSAVYGTKAELCGNGISPRPGCPATRLISRSKK